MNSYSNWVVSILAISLIVLCGCDDKKSRGGTAPIISIASAVATPSAIRQPTNSSVLAVSASASDNSLLTYTWSKLSGPGSVTFFPNGTASSNNSTATFNAVGSYVLEVAVITGSVSTTREITVVVQANPAPIITEGSATSVTMDEDNSPVAFALALNASDVDADPLTWSISRQGAHGTAIASGTGTQKVIDYTPVANWNGTDSFEVQVSDGVNTDSILVDVTVNSVNDSPIIAEGTTTTVTMDEDTVPTPFSLTLNATDPDGDTITWLILGAASNGTAAANGTGTYTPIGYTPLSDYCGTDAFVVQANDGKGGVDTITVNVIVRSVVDSMRFPTRICSLNADTYLVSDPKAKSVFVLDASLAVTNEIKQVGTPLAIAVDDQGVIYVGDDESDSILLLDGTRQRIGTWATGAIEMPNDMKFDTQGRLFVVNSKANTVNVYSKTGSLLHSFGTPTTTPSFDGLNFPCAIALSAPLEEYSSTLGFHVYVADQMNTRIAVFKDSGEFVKTLDGKSGFGFAPQAKGMSMMGMFGSAKFTRIQGLAVDTTGMLHVLDSHRHSISILDPDGNSISSTYGAYGTNIGTLNLPLGIHLDATGKALVTNSNSKRVDLINQN